MRRAHVLLILLAGGLLGCGGSNGSSTDPDPTPTLAIGFTRVPSAGLDGFTVQVSVTGSSDAPTISVDRGSISDPVATADGWQATVTPTTTGEYLVSATIGAVSASRVALVLQDVHADWGQPEMVAGSVNTPGYEDGTTITPDGRYLFVQYGPYYWAGLLVFNTARAAGGAGGNRLSPTLFEHPWMDQTIGPTAAPQRPGFPSGRIGADGANLHNAVSWGVDPGASPVLAWSTAFFGFKRQDDGSFDEPFMVAFDDLNDGIINPFGLNFLPLGGDRYRAVFSLQDTATTDAGFDLYRCDLTAGEPTNLGTYAATTPGNPPARATPFDAIHIDLGTNSGTQGNSFIERDATGEVTAIWTDDEYDSDADTHKLSVHVIQSGTFPGTTDYLSTVLPDVVNVPGTEAIQPSLEDDGLYFTQDTSIAFAAYTGAHSAAAYADAGNWTAPTVILQKDTNAGPLDLSDVGKIVAIGEPSLAVIDGHRVLFFVYARLRGIDAATGLPDLDFQIGQIRELAAAIAASG